MFLLNSKLLFLKDYQNKSSVPQSQFYSLLTQLLDHRDCNRPPECQTQLDFFATFRKYNGRNHQLCHGIHFGVKLRTDFRRY